MLQAGDYVVTIMDHFGADFSVLFVAACECIAVMWVYGKMLRRVSTKTAFITISGLMPHEYCHLTQNYGIDQGIHVDEIVDFFYKVRVASFVM